MATPFPGTVWTITDDSGNPINGAKIYTYAAGTLTAKAAYTTSALSVATSNPIITDPDGTARFYFGSGAYRIRVFDANDVELPKYAEDNMTGPDDISSDLAAPSGSELVGFLQSGTGAVSRTTQAKMRDVVCVMDFGAVGDGVADDTIAMQAAHNTGRLVYYPAGTYKFITITISAGGIVGDGNGYTKLRSTDTTTANLITYTGGFVNYGPGNPTNNGIFRDFLVSVDILQKSAGAAIALIPSGGNYTNSPLVQNVSTNYVPIGVNSTASEFLKIIGCEFRGYTIAGVLINNTYNADQGDATIMGCAFVTNPAATGDGVLQLASGGLKIIGNKFLGGAYSYRMAWTGAGSSILVISGNSLELALFACISIGRTSGVGTMANITITGNMVGQTPTFVSSDSSGFAEQLVITGNTVTCLANASIANTAGVTLNNFAKVLISDNQFNFTGAGVNTGISLVNCTNNIKIGRNIYVGCSADKAIDTSASTFYLSKDLQTGSLTTGTSGYVAYGALFLSALQTVTFPVAFQLTPTLHDIKLSIQNADGAVGFVLISVSKTQFTYYVVTQATALATTAVWSCSGTV